MSAVETPAIDAAEPGTATQPSLYAARAELMHWPHVANPAEVEAIIDRDFVLAFNAGPTALWQPWQTRRLNDLVGWLSQSLW